MKKNNFKVLFYEIVISCIFSISLLLLAYGERTNEIFLDYLKNPIVIVCNVLPVAVISLFSFEISKGNHYVVAFVDGIIYALCASNYFKLIFRDDPIIFEDILLIKEAIKFSRSYKFLINLNLLIPAIILIFNFIYLYSINKKHKYDNQKKCTKIIIAIVGLVTMFICMDSKIYKSINNYNNLNRWDTTEYQLARGFIYPFLYSIENCKEKKPVTYDERKIIDKLSIYDEEELADKINVISIMREAYVDFSKFNIDGLDNSVYDMYHKIADQGIRGNLKVNVFAGGTTDTERCFLTGTSKLRNYRSNVNSYVWYLKSIGYTTEGIHPFYKSTYNRQNVNFYLGFENYRFYENDFENMTDSYYPEDRLFYNEIFKDYRINCEKRDTPYFSFNVNVQSHGPYITDYLKGNEYLCGNQYSEECKNAMNNYLNVINNSDLELDRFLNEINKEERPIVVLVFSDHLPWMGDGNKYYEEMGIDFSGNSVDFLEKKYTTEYIIWANDAAKKALGHDVRGEGDTISTCYLMNYLFKIIGLNGPAYMQEMNKYMETMPVISSKSEENKDFMCIQYYWRNNFLYNELLDNSTYNKYEYFWNENLSVEIGNNNNIKICNETQSIDKLVFAWYVKEKNEDSYEIVYTEWYSDSNEFSYQYEKEKEYEIVTFVRKKGSDYIAKHDSIYLQWNNIENKWEITKNGKER